jgi:hypothetical protein
MNATRNSCRKSLYVLFKLVTLIFLIPISAALTALNCVIGGKTTTLWAKEDFFNFSDLQDIGTEIRNVEEPTYRKLTLE